MSSKLANVGMLIVEKHYLLNISRVFLSSKTLDLTLYLSNNQCLARYSKKVFITYSKSNALLLRYSAITLEMHCHIARCVSLAKLSWVACSSLYDFMAEQSGLFDVFITKGVVKNHMSSSPGDTASLCWISWILGNGKKVQEVTQTNIQQWLLSICLLYRQTYVTQVMT